MGRKTKYDPKFIPIVEKLVQRGLADIEIADVLEISEQTLYAWKRANEAFALAMQRAKGVRVKQIEESLIARANGFERKVQKATASGKVVTVNEYFPPDVQAQRFYLQHNKPEVYREQREVKQLVGVEEGFLAFLQRLDDKAKLERETGQLPKLIEHQVEDAVVIEGDDEGELR